MTEAQVWNIIIYSLAFFALGFFVRKWITALDRKVSEVCIDLKSSATKEELSKSELRIAKEIDEVWARVNHHKHSTAGEVIIPISHP